LYRRNTNNGGKEGAEIVGKEVAETVVKQELKQAGTEAVETIAKEESSKLWKVGLHEELRGTEVGLESHHIGQKKWMIDNIPGYDVMKAPAMLVPKIGHTTRGARGIVSRNTTGIANLRDLIARDIREMRRVYPNVPNEPLQKIIQMNKEMYPSFFKK